MQTPQTTLWDAARTWHLQGKTDALREHIGDLVDLIGTADLAYVDCVRAKAIAAQTHCVMLLDIDAAVRCLEPYVQRDASGRITIDDNQVASVAAVDASLAGLILTAAANVLYRRLQYGIGAAAARQADNFFRQAAQSGGEGLECFLGRMENEVWSLRLDWRIGEHVDFTQRIGALVKQLILAYPRWGLEAGGRIDLLLALALNRWAVFDLALGDLDAARKRIYRAVYLLNAGTVQDSIRLAYTLYTAARIESAISETDFIWARRLQQQAGALFAQHKHPFKARSDVHLAICFLKAGRLREAKEVLQRISPEAVVDEHERNLVTGERMLAEICIAEREAADDPVRWQRCVDLAAQLRDAASSGRLTKRLLAEGHCHLGRALTRVDRSDEGRRELLAAIEAARADGRVKIEIAAHLALAESYAGAGDSPRAQAHWAKSERLLARAPSSYLSQWRDRLAPKLSTTISVDVASKTYNQAKEEFLHAYLEFQYDKCGGDLDQVRAVTGLARSTFYQLRKPRKRG